MYGRGGGMRGYGGGGARGGGDRYGRRRYEDGPRGGAEHLARIHGTEEDKVNCPFYFKIGACRHGERCTRQHHKPPFSQTLLLSHMYQNPAGAIIATGGTMAAIDTAKAQNEFEDFYEEVYEELSKFGIIEEMHVCDNLGDHLVGNVYAKFSDEEEADAALKGLYGRWYAGRPIVCEFSPVTDFREARCRQYDEATCGRGGQLHLSSHQCNFMHVRYLSSSVVRWCERQALHARREREHSESTDRSRSRSRERSNRGRSRSRERNGERRRRGRSDSRDRDRDRRDYKRSRRERRDRSDDERGSPDRRRDRRDTSDDERGAQDRRRRRDRHREHENTYVRSEDREQSRDRLNQEGPTREANGTDETRNGVSGDVSS